MRQWQQLLQLAANPSLRICFNVMPGVISKISQRLATSLSKVREHRRRWERGHAGSACASMLPWMVIGQQRQSNVRCRRRQRTLPHLCFWLAEA